MRTTLTLVALSLLGGCLILSSGGLQIPYEAQPLRLTYDFGTRSGTVPDLDCTNDITVCSQVPQPAGTMASCDATTRRCVLLAEVRLSQILQLSSETGFPDIVTTAPAIARTSVSTVRYWGENGLGVPTPPIEIYVGPEAAQREGDAGTVRLGTLGSIPAASLTACRSGAPGTRESACLGELTEDGRRALERLAMNFRTPFRVIIVARIQLRGGDPLPSGKLDLMLQPAFTFFLNG